MQSINKPLMTLAAVIFLVFSFSAARSQTNRFSISLNSLTTNFNYGNRNHSLEPYKNNYKGLQAGFSYQAGLSSRFSVVPELYFAMKGGTLKENNPVTGGKSTLRLNSLELPVLARFHFRKFYLNAGPYAAYNVGGRIKTSGTGAAAGTTKISFGNSSPAFERWDMGWQSGAGYNFNLKQSILTLDVRYGYGLVNISPDIGRYNRMLNISLQAARKGKK